MRKNTKCGNGRRVNEEVERGRLLTNVPQEDGSHIYVDAEGYHKAVLRDNNNVLRDKYLHELVASTFIPNPHGYTKVRHKDGDKNNNHADNLEWVPGDRYPV